MNKLNRKIKLEKWLSEESFDYLYKEINKISEENNKQKIRAKTKLIELEKRIKKLETK